MAATFDTAVVYTHHSYTDVSITSLGFKGQQLKRTESRPRADGKSLMFLKGISQLCELMFHIGFSGVLSQHKLQELVSEIDPKQVPRIILVLRPHKLNYSQGDL